MSRIIIFTGKGGVGKTMMAASHALYSASGRKKTLLVSTDMAHNLGDMLGRHVGSTIMAITPYLDAAELDAGLIIKHDFPEFMKALEGALADRGVVPGKDGRFELIPGTEDIMCLMKIADIYESGDYDRIIVDCAPSGETLNMLKLPEMLAWYFEKFFPVGRTAMRVLRPVSKTVFNVQMPNKEAVIDAEKIFNELMKLQEILKKGDECTVRLVMMPEKMVLEETKRTYTYLNLYHYQVDGIYMNRIIPESAGQGEEGGFFTKWIGIQQEYIREAEQVFRGIPMMKTYWYPEEIRGEEAVQRFAEENIGRFNREIAERREAAGDEEGPEDVFSVLGKSGGESYERYGNGYCLRIAVPFLEEGGAEVTAHDLDITIRVGNDIRCIPLPFTLTRCEVTGVITEGEELKVIFTPKQKKRT
ncbi:MAG: ArsA family ATPase [Lachnospiraceae bacterium]|nr:ArsA family ATPase [Lachnospiraceae bacterium]